MPDPKPNVERWRATVAALSAGLPVPLLLGLIDRLSGGNPQFVGDLGGRGLYQIAPNIAEANGVDSDSLFDPQVNISLAVEMLRRRANEIVERAPGISSGDLGLIAIASYLWGPGTILPYVEPGDTAASVFAKLGDPEVEQFALDVFQRAAAYTPTSMQPSNGNAVEQPKKEPSTLRMVLYLGVPFVLVSGAIWYFGRNKEDDS